MSQQRPSNQRNPTADSIARLRVQFQTLNPPPLPSQQISRRHPSNVDPYIPSKSPISATVLMNSTNPAYYTTSGTAMGRFKQTQPLRSTKTSHKLVLFPEDVVDKSVPPEEDIDFDETASVAAGYVLPLDFTVSGRTDAERMKRGEREAAHLPRVTAYCTAEGYQLKPLRKFLRESHNVLPRLYDECLYAPYHFPLVVGNGDNTSDGARVQSAPWIRSPGGGSVLDRELASFEEQNMDFEEDNYFANAMQNQPTQEEVELRANSTLDRQGELDREVIPPDSRSSQDTIVGDQLAGESSRTREDEEAANTVSNPFDFPYSASGLAKPFEGGELFIFDYGVIVFWNFPRETELLLLEDMASFRFHPIPDPDGAQIEEMHFQYDMSQAQPRIFNDMITLKSGNHMIKLTISHAISQSAVLARFEDMMEVTIQDTKHIPKKLALTGRLDMTRTDMTKFNGRLFKLRMNVNLVSNVLDTPEIFWSEPSLQPLYNAIRGYLEIPQRAKILNDRCTVISDMLSMLREHMSSSFVSYQTWIIIWLIVVAVIVASGEIAVKSLSVK
ncbi:hypothetical protein BC937DRAFT_86135 [Endogone sp. FLAS-F59071]|nr:hypothetical protein BC937DRAFT_86135 [Endogone sp. FLAS-F59071]|eukprot:RUS23450.1 hypothetical protein BC937DRAFT_86135 [Endogone sp. FLAS-F59071]